MIKVRAIIEMLGAPKEYIFGTLQGYVEKLKSEGLKVTNESFADPKEQGELFSAFAELDVEFEKPIHLLSFCFDSMPSTVDILEPKSLALSSVDLTNFLNDLQGRLHEADMTIKTLTAQQKVLNTNATEVFKKFILHLLEHSPLAAEVVADKLQLSVEDVQPFLNHLVEKGLVVNDRGVYRRVEKRA